jgi:hypothetical protein
MLFRQPLSGARFSSFSFPTVLIGSACATTQYHESSEDDEKSTSHSGGYFADLATLHPQDPRYQEGLFLLAFAAEGTE